MFGNIERDKKIKDLQGELKALRDRLGIVEARVEPIRVGDLTERHPLMVQMGGYRHWIDPRPQVTLSDVILKIMAHLKIAFTKVDAVPERVELEKLMEKHK